MKRIFSGKLYAEGLRRLLLPGIISLVLMTVLQTVSTILPFGLRVEIIMRGYTTPDGSELLELITLLLPGILLPFFFIASAFGFLHRREGSDFYHALAVPRSGQCLSLWLAAMTWVAAAATLSVLTVLLLHWVGIANRFFDPGAGVLVLAVELTLALLSAGASLLAICLTGTRFTAAGVTAIILLLPRLWVGSFAYLLYAQLPVLGHSGVSALRLNLLADTLVDRMLWQVAGIKDFLGVDQVLPSFLYTGGLGLLYTALGVLAFCRRKSEIAGRAVPNRFLQGVYRISLALLFCAPACLILLTRTGWMARAVIYYLLAALTYFGFELIATRRWKSLLKALPGLAAVAAINLLFIGGYRLAADRVLAITPDAEDIASVRFVDERDWGTAFAPRNNWFIHRLCGATYEELPVRELVAKSLHNAVYQLKSAGDLDSNTRTVEFRANGRTYLRRLPLNGYYTLFSDEVLTGEKGHGIVSDLPAVGDGVTLNAFGELTGEKALEAYDILRQEFRQADPTALARYLQGVYLYDSQMRPTYPYQSEYGDIWVKLTVREEGNTYTQSLPVPSFCPRALTAYFQGMKQGKQVLAELMEGTDLQRIDYTIHHLSGRAWTYGGSLLMDSEYIGYDLYREIAWDVWDRLEDDLDLEGMTVELKMELKGGRDYSELFTLREIPPSLLDLTQWE